MKSKFKPFELSENYSKSERVFHIGNESDILKPIMNRKLCGFENFRRSSLVPRRRSLLIDHPLFATLLVSARSDNRGTEISFGKRNFTSQILV